MVDVADKSASFSSDEGRAVVRRDGELFQINIAGPKGEVIFEEKVSGEDRAKAESALSDLRAVIKSDDGEAIARKTEALTSAAAGIAQQAYAAGQGAEPGADGADGAAAGGEGQGASSGASGSKAKDNVVDAEFEEVKDKDRRAS